MMACNLRSLLVAAIFLSNCITWTASRHHYTHNVSGHRSRHRRQGAGLYRPATFVLPGGEGDGWGDWGEVSACSRTCGGGVASQKRICLKTDTDGRPQCSGGDTKYFSCQTQECPEGSIDFRAQQCSEFNDKDFRGVTYEWIPFTKTLNPCELNCMPRGEHFYYRHVDKVLDGTRCHDDSFDVCVNGVCQPVGCDMMLGSEAREDDCRVCRGNGSTCHTINGVFDSIDFDRGYNEILLIPEGSTNITIEEKAESNNYLALRGMNGTYYLNGYYRIDFPKSFVVAGALWHYERNQYGLAAPDKLRCAGPTKEPLYVSIYLQQDNVGINYKYSVPNNTVLPTNQSYSWVHDKFTPCNLTCGGGYQTRNVTCQSNDDQDDVDDALCNVDLKPAAILSCNTQPCDARWEEGPWSNCSQKCGPGGVQSRNVTCERVIANGLSCIVNEQECFESLGPKPQLFKKCNETTPCPKWFVGPWKPCDRLCDEGKETREVICHVKANGRVEIFDDKECADEKPAAEKPCLLGICDGVDWVTTNWIGCDTCLSTHRHRQLLCVTNSTVPRAVNDSFCSYHKKPATQEPCTPSELPACDAMWYASQWSKCSVECGEGVQKRKVFCGTLKNNIVEEIEEGKCDPKVKYNDTKPCHIPAEECPLQWYLGTWSACPCDKGFQLRQVMTFKGRTKVEPPPDAVFYDTTNKCDNKPCSSVTTTAPVEYCPDDYYPEAGLEEDELIFTSTLSDAPYSGSGAPFAEAESSITEGESGSGFGSTPTLDITDGSGDDMSPTILDTTTDDDADTDFIPVSTPSSSTNVNASDTTESSDSLSTNTDSPATGSTAEEVKAGSTDGTDTTGSANLDTTTAPSAATDVTNTGSTDTNTGSTDIIGGDSSVTELSTTETDISAPTGTPGTDVTDDTTGTGSTISSDVTGSTDEESSTSGVTSTDLDATGTTVSGSTEEQDTTTSGTSTSDVSGTTETGITTNTPEEIATTSDISTGSTNDELSVTVTTGSDVTSSEDGTPTTDGTVSSSDDTSETTTGGTSTESTTSSGDTDTTTEFSSSSTEIDSTGSTETNTGSTSGSETTMSVEESTTPGGSITTDANSPTSESSSEATTVTESSSDITTGSEAIGVTTESGTSVTGSSSEATTTSVPESSVTTTGSDDISPTTESSTLVTGSSPEATTTSVPESSVTTTGSDDISPTTESSTLGTGSSSEATTTSVPESSVTTTGSDDISPTTESSTLVTGSSSEVTAISEREPSDKTTGSEDIGETTVASTLVPESSSELTTTAASASSDETTGSEIGQTTGAGTSVAESSPETTTSAAGTKVPLESSTSPKSTGSEGSSTEGITLISETSTEGVNIITTKYTPAVDIFNPLKTTRMCIPRPPEKRCENTEFGCCPDRVTAATGPFDLGCKKPRTCLETLYGCCPDGVTPAPDEDWEGCPKTPCAETLYGCCPDNKTAAGGNDLDDCPDTPSCIKANYGCCPDNKTEATGPKLQGCPEQETTIGSTDTATTENESTSVITTGTSDIETSSVTNTGTDDVTENNTSIETSTVVNTGTSAVTEINTPSETSSVVNTGTSDVTEAENATGTSAVTEINTPSETSSDINTGTSDVTEAENATGTSAVTEINTPSETSSVVNTGTSVVTESETDTDTSSVVNTGTSAVTESTTDTDTSDTTTRKVTETETSTEAVTTTVTTQLTMVPEGCSGTKFGCCYDNETAATEVNGLGCPCNATEFGCCPDGESTAEGPNQEGCECRNTTYGCCSDGASPAHGPDFEGCCLLTAFGCCPDNRKPAEGPHLEGCGCQFSQYGCCPDNVTAAEGADNKGCGCQYTQHGCCPDRHTDATGPEYKGCPCSTFQFGCCPDGVTLAKGPELQGCHCRDSPYGCCGDDQTPANSPDASDCDCAASKFGCCLDGVTAATGPKFLGCTDVPENKQAVCSLGRDSGSCHNYTAFWFYDLTYGGCSRFWYGGCEGNGNRFATKEDCEDVCVQPAPKDACKLPAVKGPCEGDSMRWHYDSERELCMPFNYGGCLGNDNRFETQQLCQAQCQPDTSTDVCSLGVERGSCAGNYSRWGYSRELGRCVQFAWGGCEGTANRFGSEAACRLRCSPQGALAPRCVEPQEAGNCTSKKPLWSFSQSENRCVPFYYSGCGGNDNRFDSRATCELTCPSAYEPNKCTLPPAVGNCAEYRLRWFYDTSLQSCRQFYYGGCGGNANNFEGEKECKNTCSEVNTTTTTSSTIITTTTTPPPPQPPSTTETENVPDKCTLPAALGTCDEYSLRWFYDISVKSCRQFYYGGCEGNANNFETQAECENTCTSATTTITTTTPPQATTRTGDLVDKCTLPSAMGTCDEYTTRWYYDTSSQRCTQFYYGGCGGNANNFETEEECKSTCSGVMSMSTTTTTTTTTITTPPQITTRTGDLPDKCTLPSVMGTCGEYTTRWFYDTSSQRCTKFYYGGCGGNANNFETEEECKNTCSEVKSISTTTTTTTTTPPQVTTFTVPDKCTLPAAMGTCGKYTKRWFYDTSNQRCRQFYYGGCEGNANNFETEAECESTCASSTTTTTTISPPQTTTRAEFCLAPIDVGSCTNYQERWAYDSATGKCKTFQYGGCGGNRNNYPSEHYCSYYCHPAELEDICQLPMATGPCGGSVMMWFYNSATDSCSQFAYGGCEGNGNRFESRAACENRCRRSGTPTTTSYTVQVGVRIGGDDVLEQCKISARLEACSAAGEVWFYDPTVYECVKHDNQATGDQCRTTGVFPSQESCERTCGAFRGVDWCAAPKDPGPCSSYVMKVYYNQEQDYCDYFQYGGCYGSANRFSTIEECSQVCKPANSLTTTTVATPAPSNETLPGECVTPSSLARCGEGETVFYYDSKRRVCVESDIGGCGHPNSYRTEEECERKCGRFRGSKVCEARLDPGPCQSSIPKYYWDSASAQCLLYAYGGCEGGPNRFSFADECEQVCGNTGPAPSCLEQVDSGSSCEQPASARWYYSPSRANCVAFTYLGCGGTANNFRSYDECALACKLHLDYKPSLPPNCTRYEDECRRLRCQYGVARSYTDEGCTRCACDCEPARQNCEALSCPYGVKKQTGRDGCENCQCNEDPCVAARCGPAERCVAEATVDPLSREPLYFARCVPEELPRTPTLLPGQETNVASSEGDTATLRCLFHSNPPPAITWTHGVITIAGDMDRYRLLSDGALEIVDVRQTDSGVYICVADNGVGVATQHIQLDVRGTNEVQPCEHYTRECVQLRCEGDVQRTPTSDGCTRCTCAPREVDCTPYRMQCEQLSCPYGIDKTEDNNGCPRCVCAADPCAATRCAPGERCAVLRYRDPATRSTRYSVECRSVNKPGMCPVEEAEPNEVCHTKCVDDASCRGDGKCCARGCSRVCLKPAPPATLTTHAPDFPQLPPVPTLDPQQETQFASSEGGKATLRCLFHSNPPPAITWRRGEITIDGNVDRYRLLSDGTLEIVSLYRNDTGVYICVADNGVGVAKQEIYLVVKVPVVAHIRAPSAPLAVGDELSLICEIDGFPDPDVYWSREGVRLSSDDRTTISGTSGVSRLTVARLAPGDAGLYACHASNEYSSDTATSQISIKQDVLVPARCTDNPYFANCALIVRNNFCKHNYYGKFCCKSCVEAGQLAPEEAAQADQPSFYRRK